jgi:hypothetical protein
MLAPTRPSPSYTVYRTERRRFEDPAPGAWPRARRIALAASLVALVPALASFASAMVQPSNSSFFINAVEWLRSNGARGLVNRVENEYYSLTAPAKGGPPLHRLPGQKGALAAAAAAPRHLAIHHYLPAAIKPLGTGLPGEGVWHATWAAGGSRPPVLITSFRPDPIEYPRAVVGVAWIDHTRTSVELYPGAKEPAVPLPSRGPEEVPPPLRSGLLATFNSGFKLSDSGGGFAFHGHTYTPLRDGTATLVRYRNGKVNVTAWTAGADAPANVVWARQNLPLIVNHGAPNPILNDGPEWGFTLGNAALVWRSAVGVDRHGNLIYAAGPDQGLSSLASAMIHAGAVRAMELDINTYWTSFISYRNPGARGAANLLVSMDRSPLRYLSPDDRDFFAVYIR